MIPSRKQDLQEAIQREGKKFEQYYLWMESHLPPSFFEDADSETVMLVAHSLMGFDVQDYFSHIHFKNKAIALCLDSSDADLQILRHYRNRGIKNYRTFVSNVPPPFPDIKANLRVAVIYFTEFHEEAKKDIMLADRMKEIFQQVKSRNPNVTETEFKQLIDEMNGRFLRSLTKERLILAFDVFFRAKLRDPCQIEMIRNEEWKEKKDVPSLQIVLAWRNVPKHDFLFRLTRVIHRHGLALTRMAATYIDPYSRNNILLMSLGVHGMKGKAAWEETDIDDFLQELVTVKYFPGQETIETTFVDNHLVRGNLGNLIKTWVHLVHQILVHADPYLYSFANIEEGLCRHPELTVMLTEAFEARFHPEKHDLNRFNKIREELAALVDKIDTGQEANDNRRKNILKEALNCIDYTLKTNFYRKNKTAFSFRL
ncbi:MAG TPA: NAD-glutamate dehydrogenase, partial [Rhabdochlamydiaceae bacterium]|nr:NAD-glutamate dehydrogenase [Rhabdochlamydiaceae bacterium]